MQCRLSQQQNQMHLNASRTTVKHSANKTIGLINVQNGKFTKRVQTRKKSRIRRIWYTPNRRMMLWQFAYNLIAEHNMYFHKYKKRIKLEMSEIFFAKTQNGNENIALE